LLAQFEKLRATTLTLLAHDKHAALVVFAGAAATQDGLGDLDLFAGTGVLDNMPDVDDALQAGVRVILFLSGWVR
jgi:hypothetical protein